ncbi:MAG: hypothetical protein GC181_07560 [Bacteroidetes bacterium]|nr:hypothetical protein [Bacteroidota bacterium]
MQRTATIRFVFFLIIFVSASIISLAQNNGAKWTAKLEQTGKCDSSGCEVKIILSGEIPAEHHVYATGYVCENGGPLPAQISMKADSTVQVSGDLISENYTEAYDDIFECTIREFHEKGTFVQKLHTTGNHIKCKGKLSYQMCFPDGRCVLYEYEFAFDQKLQ